MLALLATFVSVAFLRDVRHSDEPTNT